MNWLALIFKHSLRFKNLRGWAATLDHNKLKFHPRSIFWLLFLNMFRITARGICHSRMGPGTGKCSFLFVIWQSCFWKFDVEIHVLKAWCFRPYHRNEMKSRYEIRRYKAACFPKRRQNVTIILLIILYGNFLADHMALYSSKNIVAVQQTFEKLFN